LLIRRVARGAVSRYCMHEKIRTAGVWFPKPFFSRALDEAVPQVPRQLAGFANDSLSLNRL